jgi:hypothetical protein
MRMLSVRCCAAIAVAWVFRPGVFLYRRRKFPASEEAGYNNWRNKTL